MAIGHDGSAAVVREQRGDELIRGFGRVIAAHAGLNVWLHGYIERDAHTRLMLLADPRVPADEPGEGHALRRGEGEIPSRAMRPRHRLARRVPTRGF